MERKGDSTIFPRSVMSVCDKPIFIVFIEGIPSGSMVIDLKNLFPMASLLSGQSVCARFLDLPGVSDVVVVHQNSDMVQTW